MGRCRVTKAGSRGPRSSSSLRLSGSRLMRQSTDSELVDARGLILSKNRMNAGDGRTEMLEVRGSGHRKHGDSIRRWRRFNVYHM